MSAAAPSLQKGQLFDSFDNFKSALDDWAVQAKFSRRAKKSNALASYSPKSASSLFNANRYCYRCVGLFASLSAHLNISRRRLPILRAGNPVQEKAGCDYISEPLSLESYYYSYEKNVQTVKVTTLKAQATDKCLAPILKRGRRIPRTRRVRKHERHGLLLDTEDRLTNRRRVCGCVGHNSLTCVEPVQVPFVP